ncbi:MAG TPA: lasso peptide biosynthesis B2 protein [Candidatus Limnocylindria bacterium]|nr:lasso peptide biosynthesis B2 protein [Candidatus Limnocylindria bacterium]
METWRRFWRLTGFERVAVFEAAAGLGITWLGLRITGFRRWKTIAELFTRATTPNSDAVGDAKAGVERDIARMAAAAAHYLPFRTNCLEQSLVLWWLLQRHGIAADLKIGARKEANRFEAHAWVEFEGGVIGGADEEHRHFVPFEGSVASMETQTH